MTDLKLLLASNLKRFRGELGLSQAKLAEKAKTTTHYVGMIEIARHFPSPEMLEKLAEALNVDTPELFSMQPSPAGTLPKLHASVLQDMQQAASVAVEQALRQVVQRRIEELKETQ